MVTLVEAGYADQNDVARAFGYATRSVRRYHAHYEAAGLAALVRGPGRPPRWGHGASGSRRRDQTILALKTRGASNRSIAGKLGIDERVVRRTLRRLDWRPVSDARLPFSEQRPARPAPETAITARPQVVPPVRGRQCRPAAEHAGDAVPLTLDIDPLDRSMDRLLAAMGRLEDAAPLFAATESFPAPACCWPCPRWSPAACSRWRARSTAVSAPPSTACGRRWSPTCCWRCLRIPRPEMLKEYAPGDLGRIVGLDRMPEVKTLRRKLARLAAMKPSAGTRARDGPAAHRRARPDAGVPLRRRARPRVPRQAADRQGVPDARAHRWTGHHRLLGQRRNGRAAVRRHGRGQRRHDPDAACRSSRRSARCSVRARRLTVVFDRGGWSPKLFRQIVGDGLRHPDLPQGPHAAAWPTKRFVPRDGEMDGRRVEYLLHDQAVRFLKGKLRLRQVTRLTRDGPPDGDPDQPVGPARCRGRVPHVRAMAPGEFLQVHARGVPDRRA